MAVLREWLARVWGALRRGRSDADITEELHAHLALARDEAMRCGRSASAATRDAAVASGGLMQTVESMREQRGLPWIDDFLRDVRYAIRVLRRHPGFTVVAGGALALGIGVNTAVFTAYRASVTRPLDARDPDRLVNVALLRSDGGTSITFSNPDYEAYRDSVSAFDGVVAFFIDRLTLTGAGDVISQSTSSAASQFGRLGLLTAATNNVEFATTNVVSENYFQVLGVRPVRGRSFESFTAEELRTTAPVLISANYWARRFGSDPAVLGMPLRLNGAAVTVVGITPGDFIGTGVAVPDFWAPLSLTPIIHSDDAWLRNRENEKLRIVARLAPRTSLARAQAEAEVVGDRLRAFHDPRAGAARPANVLVWRGSPFPLPLAQYPGLLFAVRLIMLAALMVLVVACANVASLQLARSRARLPEVTTRLSLGASRSRVLRQLLAESTLLGLISGAAALVVTWLILRALAAGVANAMPVDFGTIVFNVSPDLSIFAFVCAISIAAGVIFGLLPAIHSARTSLVASERSMTESRGGRRLQGPLVGVQVAGSLVLLIAGSLLIRSAIHAVSADPGYDAAHVIDVSFQFPDALRYSADRKEAVARALMSRLEALPGVTSVAAAQAPGLAPLTAIAAGDQRAASTRASIEAYALVPPDYFDTIGVPLRLGRGFGSAAPSAPVVILSESTARQLWPGQNPIGRHVRLGAVDEKPHSPAELVPGGTTYEVIDVARDTRGVGLTPNDARMIYLRRGDTGLATRPFLLRVDSDPHEVLRAIAPAIAAVDPDVLVTVSTLDDQLRQSGPFIVASLAAIVATAVGLVGLLLAAMGIFGTVSYLVARRTREIGIRIAIGATRRDILRLVLGESVRPVVAGIGVGIALAIGVSFVLRDVLYGVALVDGVSFAGVSALFLAIALFAAWPPARRAMRIAPTSALREL